MPPRLTLALLNPRGLTGRTVNLPNDVDAMRDYDREDIRTVEIPAATGSAPRARSPRPMAAPPPADANSV